MIASIQGKLINKGEDHIVLSLNGLGFHIFTTNEVREKSNMGDMIFLFSQLIVREDSLTLFGFEREIEKSYFNLLNGVSGIGPKLALGIINSLSIDAINRAVSTEQSEMFARVPGVGKKTAQKIVIHLHGKIGGDGQFDESMQQYQDVDLEVLDALTTLGYSVIEAQSAIQSIPRDTPNEIEERLRVALKYFS
jgi:Holliday junction DNA helicase RuvA